MARKSDGGLDGKVAFITGAVRRIGRAMALALAEEGASVVVNARNSVDEGNSVVAEIEARGGRAAFHRGDVTDEAQVAAMVAAIVGEFGRLDILINNAADRGDAPFTKMSFAEWREVTGIILDGAFLCSRACIPQMIRNGSGTIINIGGVSAHTGVKGRVHVGTAKAGLEGLTRGLAVEFASAGITVNCVAPGRIGGERGATAGTMPAGKGPIVGRLGTSDEVAAMVLALCLPTGKFVTGQTVHVNGGTYFS